MVKPVAGEQGGVTGRPHPQSLVMVSVDFALCLELSFPVDERVHIDLLALTWPRPVPGGR